MGDRLIFVTLLFAGLSLGEKFSARSLAAEPAARLLAWQQSPDFVGSDGAQLSAIAELPAISGNGAAFRAELHTLPASNLGVFVSDGDGPPREIARRGGPAVGAPGSASFAYFVDLHATNAGRTAFMGTMTGDGLDGESDHGIWASDPNGQLTLVARAGGAVPGFDESLFYNRLLSEDDKRIEPEDPKFSMSGDYIAFHSGLHGPTAIDSNDRALFVAESAEVRLVARRGNTVPGASDNAVFATFLGGGGPPSINQHGQVAFQAALDQTSKYQGIFVENAARALTAVAFHGDQAPGTALQTTFNVLYGPRINNDGRVAFATYLAGPGIGPQDDTAIYAGGAGGLSLVAREGSPAPGTNLNTTFGDLGNNITGVYTRPVINGAGQVAFFGRLAGLGVSDGNDSGIWMQDRHGDVQLIAREGDAAPGGGVFDDLNPWGSALHLNKAGQIVFHGRAIDPSGNADPAQSIWATDRSGVLELIVASNQLFSFRAPHGMGSTILRSVQLSRSSGGEDGWSASLNESGQVVFWGKPPSGTALFISNAVAVPEPGTMASAIVIAAIVCVGIRSPLNTSR